MKIDIFLILIMKHRGRIQAQGENFNIFRRKMLFFFIIKKSDFLLKKIFF